MTNYLIPRSGSISAKKVESTDFEKYFSSDIITDYVKSGWTLSAGAGLSVDISTGIGRLKGLYLESDAVNNVAGLTAASTNYIYATLSRDVNSKAQSWSFTSNTTGTPPADSFLIGTATTDGSSVTSTDITTRNSNWSAGDIRIYGTGADGNATISVNTSLASNKNYNNLTINTGVTLDTAGFIVKVRGTLTINGTGVITDSTNGGAAGSAGAAVTNGGNGGSPTYVNGFRTGAGGGGGGGGLNAGGAGGKGGGVVIIYAYTLNNANVIHSDGAAGSGGGQGGGGGGGGQGGTTVVIYRTLTALGTIRSDGGAGSSASSSGGSGTDAAGGSGGKAGNINIGFGTGAQSASANGGSATTFGCAGGGGYRTGGNISTAGGAGGQGLPGTVIVLNL